MSKRKRTVMAVVIIELLLLGGWLWLHGLAMSSPGAGADGAREIGEAFGAAMGVVLAVAPLLYLLARRNDGRSAVAPMQPPPRLRQVVRS